MLGLQSFIEKLYKKEWVVYCKPPFGSAEHVIEYLGRYYVKKNIMQSKRHSSA
ncbi:MAG TPA: transposase [Clostridium sp.]